MYRFTVENFSAVNFFKFSKKFFKKLLTNSLSMCILIIVIITDNKNKEVNLMRYSRQRELVTEIIKGRCDHPTADMIYKSLFISI